MAQLSQEVTGFSGIPAVVDPDHENESKAKAGREIGIRSDYMAAGYWNDDSQTQEKFVRVGESAVPVYLTGDVGRLRRTAA